MLNFRKGCIILFNLAVGAWLAKVIFFDESSDDIGLFVLLTLFFLGIYDVYTWILYRRFPANEQHRYFTEVLLVVFLVLPLILLWGMTS
ncbi:hypothetical protein Q5H92_22510 [Hymenobacter sp. M29]|uniref:Uncharacterized protein n=1 Tax=Hymenobacter mellowenesis TaxID=3063995 RepID=A0ABT9AHW0_9BACT|nr:hypothetical protein [Hymenobacter sp. M29]MDO7849153.1 hypothetical protein [Hymenobacter sp. M29]